MRVRYTTRRSESMNAEMIDTNRATDAEILEHARGNAAELVECLRECYEEVISELVDLGYSPYPTTATALTQAIRGFAEVRRTLEVAQVLDRAVRSLDDNLGNSSATVIWSLANDVIDTYKVLYTHYQEVLP